MRTIRFADKPLSMNPEIQVLSIAEFERKVAGLRGHAFKWTEAMGPLEHPTHAGYDPSVTDNLVVCMTELGLSVFTSAAIPKGTVICTYAGEAKSREDLDRADHYLLVTPELEACAAVSARHQSNWGGLFQYAPSRGVVMSHYVDEVAFANLQFEKAADGSRWARAVRDIEAGEQLTWDYSLGYWQTSGIPVVEFTRSGERLGFMGFIVSVKVFEILYLAAKLSNDEIILKDLKRSMPDQYARLESVFNSCVKEVSSPALQKIIEDSYSRVLSMPDDFLFSLRPRDRELLLKFLFSQGVYASRSDLESKLVSHANAHKMLARFRIWKELSSTAATIFSNPDIQVLQLRVPDTCKATNEARYYVGYNAVPSAEAAEQLLVLTHNAMKHFKEKEFDEAISGFQSALRMARDALAYAWWSKIEKSKSPRTVVSVSETAASGGAGAEIEKSSYEFYFSERNVYLFDDNVVVAFWNLGNAYLQAGNLHEAEYCIAMAVSMIKVSKIASIQEHLAKYEKRLTELRSSHASAVLEAASGGAGGPAAARV